MKKRHILILTDHSGHSAENSVYAFASAFRRHPSVARVDVASRGLEENNAFFQHLCPDALRVAEVDADFRFSEDGECFRKGLRQADLSHYDGIWLRLPPPLGKPFLDFLDGIFPQSTILNTPAGIYQTGSKAFLMNFPSICAPMRICNCLEDIIAFKKQFPIVLKPFREYGGRGIIRIAGNRVWEGREETTFDEFAARIRGEGNLCYLGVKFLENVAQGDKRIVVVDGQIMGASLRLPSEGSWICNVSMGGSSHKVGIEPEEETIVKEVHPALSALGVVMYGVDTLVGDDGKRVLSEINTTSIGGLLQIARQRGLPLVEEAVELILGRFS